MHIDINAESQIKIARLSVYLPARDRLGQQVTEIEKWVKEACALLCEINGGATRLPLAEGMWWSADEGVVIHEPVHVVFSIIDPSRVLECQQRVAEFVRRFGRLTNQQVVAVEFDNVLHLVSITNDRRAFVAAAAPALLSD